MQFSLFWFILFFLLRSLVFLPFFGISSVGISHEVDGDRNDSNEVR